MRGEGILKWVNRFVVRIEEPVLPFGHVAVARATGCGGSRQWFRLFCPTSALHSALHSALTYAHAVYLTHPCANGSENERQQHC
eukprot:22218-Pyramimonas_sp.AAC.1